MSIEREMKRLMKYEEWQIERYRTGPEYRGCCVVTIHGRDRSFKGAAPRLDHAISRALKAAGEKK